MSDLKKECKDKILHLTRYILESLEENEYLQLTIDGKMIDVCIQKQDKIGTVSNLNFRYPLNTVDKVVVMQELEIPIDTMLKNLRSASTAPYN